MSEEESPTNNITSSNTIRRQNDAIKSEGNPLARLQAKKAVVNSGKSQNSTPEVPEVVEPVKLNLENLSDCRLIRPHELQPMTTKMRSFE